MNLIEPFDIDGGELDGLSQQQCFTLGVEWGDFWRALNSGSAFEMILHVENVKRLVALARRNGREVVIETSAPCCAGCGVPVGWPKLVVAAAEDGAATRHG